MTWIDPEKIPDTIAHFMTCRGVRLESRYRKQHEFDAMGEAIEYLYVAMDTYPGHVIAEIFCDTKACATYTVRLKSWAVGYAQDVCDVLDLAFSELSGGHNGVYVEAEGGLDFLAVADPWWREGDDL